MHLGDWLFDNRLGLASGTRVKISKPVPEAGAQWESYSKFKLSGMLSRVPRKFKDAGMHRRPARVPCSCTDTCRMESPYLLSAMDVNSMG